MTPLENFERDRIKPNPNRVGREGETFWELDYSYFKIHKGKKIGHCCWMESTLSGISCLYQYGPDGMLFMVRPWGGRGYHVDTSDVYVGEDGPSYLRAKLNDYEMALAWENACHTSSRTQR